MTRLWVQCSEVYKKHTHNVKQVYLHVILEEEKRRRRKKKKPPSLQISKIDGYQSSFRSVVLMNLKKTQLWLWGKRRYFLANEIFIAFDCVILKPCSASRAAPAWTSLSNSTKAMSWRPGTRRTSLKPGNLQRFFFCKHTKIQIELHT